MEFTANIKGSRYTISSTDGATYFVDSQDRSYILVRNGERWECADRIRIDLLQELGRVIEEHRN